MRIIYTLLCFNKRQILNPSYFVRLLKDKKNFVCFEKGWIPCPLLPLPTIHTIGMDATTYIRKTYQLMWVNQRADVRIVSQILLR